MAISDQKPIAISIDELLKNPQKYDNKRVLVTQGIITTIQRRKNNSIKGSYFNERKDNFCFIETIPNTKNIDDVELFLKSIKNIKLENDQYSKEKVVKKTEYNNQDDIIIVSGNYGNSAKGSKGKIIHKINEEYYLIKFYKLTGSVTKTPREYTIEKKNIALIEKVITKEVNYLSGIYKHKPLATIELQKISFEDKQLRIIRR